MAHKFVARKGGGFQVNGGDHGVFEFPLGCTRALLTRITVVQLSGSNDSFTVEIFENHPGADSETVGDSEGAYQGDLPPTLFRAVPPLAGSNMLLDWHAIDHGGPGYVVVPYAPDDVAASGRKCFLRIIPGGAGAKEFAVALSGFRGEQ